MGTAAAAAGDAPSHNELLQFEDADEDSSNTSLIKLGSFAAAAPKNSSNPSASNSKKRSRDDDDDDNNDNNNNKIPAVAHQPRLSKWAARLFDPDRPRGLIEPPKVIPLNDEFLQAFGQREKASDEARGVALAIDREIDDGDNDSDDNDETTAATATQQRQQQQQQALKTPKSSSSRKVKISNLKYTLNAAQVEAACSQFGAVEDCRLPMAHSNINSSNSNSGFAYVVFEEAASAQSCADHLRQIGGRPVSVTIVSSATASSSSASKHGGASNRYWQTSAHNQQDLSTKCFRCGGVGHRAADCTASQPKVKPCVLCASTDHSEIRDCPCSVICFHCGRPGHVLRACPLKLRGGPPVSRRVCTVCFQLSHHKVQCRGSSARQQQQQQSLSLPPSVVQQAVCLTCGQTGHFLCRQPKWFYGLEGVSCSNCGMPGHIGAFCQRPNLDACGSNADVAQQEIERAATVSSVEESLIAANQCGGNNNGGGGRGGGRGQSQHDRGRSDNRQQQQQQQQPPYRRFHSMPPRGRSDDSSDRTSPARKGRWGPRTQTQRRNNYGGGRY